MSTSLKEAIEAKKAKVAEVYTKVEEKGGTMPETRNLDNLTDAVDSIPSGGGGYYNGHLDEEGLRRIGWDEDSISIWKQRVFWNEEDDESFLVPQELINVYENAGTWNHSLHQTYNNNWWYRWMPKIEDRVSYNASSNTAPFCIGMPVYKTWPFASFRENINMELFDIIVDGDMKLGCANFWALNTKNFYFNVKRLYNTDEQYFFRNNSQVENIFGILNFDGVTVWSPSFDLNSASRLKTIWIKNLKISIKFVSTVLRKECLLYMINNEAAPSNITITLSAAIYDAYSVLQDIQEALSNHPNISIARG